jgi:SAM-dependent methyltransferase
MTTHALNWLAGNHDAFTRPQAVELQSALHQKLLASFASESAAVGYLDGDRNYWRRQVVMKSQLVMGRPFSGTVLEIGAGTGWCSSLISAFPRVEKIYCSDYDPFAVGTLMPRVQKALAADIAKIVRVLGSYNKMPLINEVDTVISIGALHHSENLFATLAESFKALKPGGWLIATEPAYPDTETNAELEARYKKEDPNSREKYGRVTRHEDNSDHYYRVCEFLAAAYNAKFDVHAFLFDLTGNPGASDQVLSARKTHVGYVAQVLYPYFAKNPAAPQYDRLLLALQKPADGGRDLGHVLSAPGRGW